MADSSSKKELEKKRAKEKQEKAERMRERKANSNKGKSLDDMMAYIDENGNITSTPPDMSKKVEINLEDIEIGVRKHVEDPADAIRKGTVTFFNEAKGYGFITDARTKESIFVHINNVTFPIKEGNMVTFEVEKGQRGLSAVRVNKA